MVDRLTQWTAGKNQSRREKSARGSVAVSPQAHGSSSMETSKPFSRRTRRAPANAQGSRCSSKETSTDRWSAALLWEWLWRRHVDAWLRSRRQAASHGLVLMTLLKSSACKQTTQPECRSQPTSSLAARKSITSAHDPAARACRKTRGLADLWYMDDGDILCHPILVPQEFDIANATVGAERNPQKTEVVYNVNDLDSAPSEWRIRDVQNMAKVSTVIAGRITLGVVVGPRQYIAD